MIDFGDYASLYFYSALFQGNMALLGLGGVFVVYRLQVLSNQIASWDSEMVRIANGIFDDVLPEVVSNALIDVRTLVPNLKRYLEHDDPMQVKNIIAPNIRVLLKDPRLNQLIFVREENSKYQESIREKYRPPFLLILIPTFLALLLIPLSSYIHHGISPWLETTLFILAATIEGVALWKTWELVMALIQQ